MFIEFVESLRCPRPHEDSWLVAAADRVEGRSILSGVLGCPVCGARYPIVEGVAELLDAAAALPAERAASSSAPPRAAEAEVLRAAALLDLAAPGGTAVLAGAWGALAPALREVAEVHLLLVNPPFPARAGEGVSVLRTGGRLPLAAGSVRAAAVDDHTLAALPGAVAALRARGRLVVPAAAPLPADVTELARDELHRVGERLPPSGPPVPLVRAR